MLQRLLRGGGEGRRHSRDPDDVLARLRRAVANLPDDGTPVQLVGDYLDPAAYRRWRNAQLRPLPGAFVPRLAPNADALVLWALPPASLVTFLHKSRSKKLISAPEVGEFVGGIDPRIALAGVLAAWLDVNGDNVRLAPPILRAPGERPHVLTLDLDWPLPATELLPKTG